MKKLLLFLPIFFSFCGLYSAETVDIKLAGQGALIDHFETDKYMRWSDYVISTSEKALISHRTYTTFDGNYAISDTTFFEFDISDLDLSKIKNVKLNFYITDLQLNNGSQLLQHASSQNSDLTGDSKVDYKNCSDWQTFAATSSENQDYVNLAKGSNSVDVTSLITSDLEKGYSYSAFFMPYFNGGTSDNSNMLKIDAFGSQAITLSASVIPEPSTYAAILGALAFGFVAYRRRK